MESITINSGVTAIGASAFGSCASLESAHLPESLLWLDPSAFNHSNSLEKIFVSENNPYYTVDEYGTLYYCGTELIWYPRLSENKICIIPEGVTAIPANTFKGASTLEQIVLPSTISLIDTGVFRDCQSLKSIIIPKGVTEIRGSAFWGCESLSEVVFEEGSVLTNIGMWAFYGCTSLKEINIPDSVETIRDNAFSKCTALERVNFTEASKLESFSDFAFEGSPFVTVYAPVGTYARAYAERNIIHVPLTVNVDGEKLISDVPPMIVYSRTMVPMRAVFEALDAEVIWDETLQTATAKKGDTIVVVTVGSRVMSANGKECLLDSPAFVFEDRIMIPARAVSEAFDYDVSWKQDIKTVDIASK